MFITCSTVQFLPVQDFLVQNFKTFHYFHWFYTVIVIQYKTSCEQISRIHFLAIELKVGDTLSCFVRGAHQTGFQGRTEVHGDFVAGPRVN